MLTHAFLFTLLSAGCLGIPEGDLTLLEPTQRVPQYPLKTEQSLVTPAQIEMARQNMEKYTQAKAVGEKIVARATAWLEWSDEDLRKLIPTADVPRAFNVGTAGSPTSGKKIYEKGGTYPWIIDPKLPFKVKDPVDGTVYPSNDYAAWYESGFTDKSLLTGDYVDNGWGWVGPDGERYWFVAYANHWIWRNHTYAAIQYLSQAYTLTGDRAFAHKAAVMLDRVAEVYPAMDYHPQSRYGHLQEQRGVRYEGKIVNLIWETGTLTELARAYDLVWDSIDGDTALQELTGKTGEAIRAGIEANILEEGIDGVLAQQIRGNYGMHQRALVYAGLARQQGPQDEWFNRLMNMAGGSASQLGLDYALYNLVYRDGAPYETSPGYNFSWVANITTVAEALRLAGRDVYAIPKTRRIYDAVLDVVNVGRCTPALGDSGNVYGGLVGRDARVYQAAYRALEDDRYLRHLAGFGATGEKGFSTFDSLLVAPVPEAPDATLPPQSSRLLDGYGMAILNNPEDTVSASIYYGYRGGHGHFDGLHFDLFANGYPMTPDTGYPDFMNAYVSGIYTWSKNTIAHNTVTVDASRQAANVHGTVTLFADSPFARAVEIEAAGTYPQCETYRRCLVMVDVDEERSYFIDVFDVEGGGQHDYSLHGPPGTFAMHGGQWTEPAPGTLAGEDVPLGEIYDNAKMAAPGYGGGYSGYQGSGFQHLFNVQRLEEGGWVAEYTHEKSPEAKLRVRILDAPGQEVILADAQVSPVKHKQLLKYVIARRTGENLKSRFVSVLEPYSGEPRIALAQLDAADGDAMILRVQCTGGRTYVIALNPGEGMVSTSGLQTDAHVAVVEYSDDGQALHRFQAGGSILRIGKQQHSVKASTGVVWRVAPAKGEVVIDLEGRPEEAEAVARRLPGEVAFFSNDLRRTAHMIEEARVEAGKLVLTLRDDLLVGRARIRGVEGNRILTNTAFQFAPVYEGAYVMDKAFFTVFPLDRVAGDALQLCEALAENHPFQQGDDAWIVNVGPGDGFEVPGVAYRENATDPCEFPIVEVTYRAGREGLLFCLLADYGYIIDWGMGDEPSFYVFDKPKGVRIKTATWGQFLEELKRLPDGIEIDPVSKCTSRFDHWMPRANHEELKQLLDGKRIETLSHHETDKHVAFCYCEASFDILFDEVR